MGFAYANKAPTAIEPEAGLPDGWPSEWDWTQFLIGDWLLGETLTGTTGWPPGYPPIVDPTTGGGVDGTGTGDPGITGDAIHWPVTNPFPPDEIPVPPPTGTPGEGKQDPTGREKTIGAGTLVNPDPDNAAANGVFGGIEELITVTITAPDGRFTLNSGDEYMFQVLVYNQFQARQVTGTVDIALETGDGTLAGETQIVLTNQSSGRDEGVSYTLLAPATEEEITLSVTLVVNGETAVKYYRYTIEDTVPALLTVTGPAEVIEGEAINLVIQCDNTGYVPFHLLEITDDSESVLLEDAYVQKYDSDGELIWQDGGLTVIINVGSFPSSTETVNFTVTDPMSGISGTVAIKMVVPVIVFTGLPPFITRDEEEVFSVALQDGLGATYEWDGTGVVTMTDEDATGDELANPPVTATFVDGLATSVPFTVTGGTGGGNITLTVDAVLAEGTSSAMSIGTLYDYSVLLPATITRGVEFDLIVQATDPSTGEVQTGYSSDITIAINGSGQSILPVTALAASWSGGAITVPCTITGGTGTIDTTFTIVGVSADGTGTSLVGGSVKSSLDYVTTGVYTGEETRANVGVPNDDPAAAGYWTDAQDAAEAEFDADTTLSTIRTGMHRSSRNRVTANIDVVAGLRAGYIQYTMSSGDKAEAVDLAIDTDVLLRAELREGLPNPKTYQVHPDVNEFYMDIYLDDGTGGFASGAALSAMTPLKSIPFTEINRLSGLTDDPSTHANVSLRLGAEDFLAGMSGLNVFVWIMFRGPDPVPYATLWETTGAGFEPYAESALELTRIGTNLEVLI